MKLPRTWILCTSLSLFIMSSCQNIGNDIAPAAGTMQAIDQNAQAKLAQARSLDSSGQYKPALRLYQSVFTDHPLSPSAPEARFAHANLLDRNRDLPNAFDSYQYFIEHYAGDPNYTQALERQAAVAQAAADGLIGFRTLGIRSKFDPNKITTMLERVRDNAPAADTAPKAQFTIGKVWQERKQQSRAIDAYQELVNEYPKHPLAPEAQFRIGQTLEQSASSGNQDKANLDAARRAYEDLFQMYPNSQYAPIASKAITSLGSKNIQRSFEIAEFYRQKGQSSSAIFYYQDVAQNAEAGSQIQQKAQSRLLGYGVR